MAEFLDFWRGFPSVPSAGFTPPADVEETDDAYVVEIELPGVKKHDLEIEVSGRRLTVRGERKETERVGVLRRQERTVGSFAYEVVLAGDVLEDKVEASLDEGVLTVRLPKPEHEQPRRIQVK
jgi:HSP20 family protein